MNDQDKTREQLLQELRELRDRLALVEEARSPANRSKEVSGFFMGLLQHAPMPIYVKSADKHFLLVNRAWEEVFGMRQEAVVGRHVSELLPEKLAQAFSITDEQVIQTGQPVDFEQCIDLPRPAGGTTTRSSFPLRSATGSDQGRRRHLHRHHRAEANRARRSRKRRAIPAICSSATWPASRTDPAGKSARLQRRLRPHARPGCPPAVLGLPLGELYPRPATGKRFANGSHGRNR